MCERLPCTLMTGDHRVFHHIGTQLTLHDVLRSLLVRCLQNPCNLGKDRV